MVFDLNRLVRFMNTAPFLPDLVRWVDLMLKELKVIGREIDL